LWFVVWLSLVFSASTLILYVLTKNCVCYLAFLGIQKAPGECPVGVCS
jgi:threonine/homoserine/homoserine lactone efflux protein